MGSYKSLEEKRRKRLSAKISKYILTISASDYVTGVGKKLSDYEFKSVSGTSLEKMVEKEEEINAKIIIDVKPTFESYGDGNNLYLIGTALIPRNK